MSKNDSVRRCVQCNRILVGDPKIELCPRCRKNDTKNAMGIGATIAVGAWAIKKFGKPMVKAATKIIKTIK